MSREKKILFRLKIRGLQEKQMEPFLEKRNKDKKMSR